MRFQHHKCRKGDTPGRYGVVVVRGVPLFWSFGRSGYVVSRKRIYMSLVMQDTTVGLCVSIRSLEHLDISLVSAEQAREALSGLASISSWVEMHRLELTRRLQELAKRSPSIVPADILVSTGSISRADAKRDIARVDTLSLLPQLENALLEGAVSVAHVDAASRAMAQLSADEKKKMASRGEWMNMVATHTTPDNFARAVRHAVQNIYDDEGITRLERQRERTWLRHWVDRDSGMVCMRGEFDPESGVRLVGRIQKALDRMLHAGGVGHGTNHDHLRALSVVALVCDVDEGTSSHIASAYSRAEISVVVDLETLRSGPHSNTVLHTGTDIDIPIETVRRMACEAKIIPIVMGSNGVVLDVGRSTRLATRTQRRALEAMHTTCAVPQCMTPVAQCHPHHIQFWNVGGTTDMDNLVPLCALHHRCAHEGGWKLSLNAVTRVLTVREPGRSNVQRGAPESARRLSAG